MTSKSGSGRLGIIGAAIVVVVGLVLAGVWYFANPSGGSLAVGDDPAWSFDPQRPYAGTPAETWADGEAGIILPPPAAVAGFTAEEVGKALQDVKKLLVTSRLDRSVIETGNVESVLALVSPFTRDYVRPELDNEGAWGESFVTRLAPGFRLLPVSPKVNGTVSVEAGAEKGELKIRTNLLYAYAFEVNATNTVADPLDTVATVRWQADYLVRSADEWGKNAAGLDFGPTEGYTYSMACEPSKQGLLAPAYSGKSKLGLEKEDEKRYFDPSASLQVEGTCA